MKRQQNKPVISSAYRYFAVAVFLLVVLALAVQMAFATPIPWRAPKRARIPNAPRPGIYQFQDIYYTDPSRYPIVGTHRAWRWHIVEPRENDYRWDIVEHWLSLVAAQGKIAGLGVNSYNGILSGGDETPRWVYHKHPAAEIVCPGDWRIPKFWDPAYQAEFEKMVTAFADRYDGDPRLAWVEISVGVYGETQPAKPTFYDCLEANGLTPSLWVETVDRYTDIYLRHFHRTQLFLQMAPAFRYWWERREFSDYAAQRGVGLKHNGLTFDQGTGVFDDPHNSNYGAGYTQIMRKWGDRVPIAWEGQDYQLPYRTGLMWGIFNGLDKHPDYILFGEKISKDESRADLVRFAQQYTGRTLADTPSVWVALRETEYPPEKHPQRGNFSFWLYQKDDVPGGRSVPLWNVGTEPEGRFTRRTDQATGNNVMYFDVDDGYIAAGNALAARVEITYLDQGHDQWALYYDSRAEANKLAGMVQKTNSNRWRSAVFDLPDAYFGNREAGHTDFHIDCLGDGDEVIHFVNVVRQVAATATPTPTRTPTLTPATTTPTPPTATPTPVPYHIVLQNGRGGYEGCQDTTIDATAPGKAHGDESTLSLRALPAESALRILLRCELAGQVPPNANVKEANLYLFVTTQSNGPRAYPRVYRLVRPWSAASATWNQASSGHPWGKAGAEAADDRLPNWFSQSWLHSAGLWYRFDITELARVWATTGHNFGLLLQSFDYGQALYHFASSENEVVDYRPQLEILYDVPGAPTPTATPTVQAILPGGIVVTFTPMPPPTVAASPTATAMPSPTATPSTVVWQVAGSVEDIRVGVTLQVPVTVTLQFGATGPTWAQQTTATGIFSLYAVAKDEGALRYSVDAPAYQPLSGVAAEEDGQRHYHLQLRLYPRRDAKHNFVPWIVSEP